MRLPKRQSQTSLSMAGAYRKPITRGPVKQEVAATQRHVSMPTNYNQVGAAQARAAQAQGQVGMALAESFIKAGDAVIAVDTINQKADYTTKVSELNSFAAGYYSTQTMRDDLTERGADKKYNYENISKNFQNELKQFEADLDKRYKLTNPELIANYGAARSGITSTNQIKLDGLVNNAKIERIKGDAANSYNMITKRDDWERFAETYSMYYSGVDMEKFRVGAQDKYNSFAIDDQLSLSSGNAEIIDEITPQIDAMEQNLQLTRQAASARRTAVNRKIKANQSASIAAMSGSDSPEEVDALMADAKANRTWDDDGTIERLGKKNKSRLIADDTLWGLHIDGEFTDSDVLLSEANTKIETAKLNGSLETADYNRAKTALVNGSKNAAKESLQAIYSGDPTGVQGELGEYLMGLETASPEQFGFSENDPQWSAFKSWAATEGNRYLAAYGKTNTLTAKQVAINTLGTSVAAGMRYAPGSDNYKEVLEMGWQLTGTTDAYKPGTETTEERLDTYVATNKYVPEAIANALALGINDPRPTTQAASMQQANEFNKLTGWVLTTEKGGGLTDYQKSAFETAQEMQARTQGIDPSTPEGAKIFSQQFSDHASSRNNPPSHDSEVLKGEVARFGSDKQEDGTWKQFYADNKPDSWGDLNDIQGSVVMREVMMQHYKTAREAGKSHYVAQQQAMGMAVRQVGVEVQPDGSQRFVKNSIFAMHNFASGTQEGNKVLNRTIEDYSNGIPLLTREEIAEGWTIYDADQYPADQVRFRYDPKSEGWVMVEASTGAPITQRKVDPNGMPTTVGGMVILSANKVSPGAQEVIDIDNAQAATDAAMAALAIDLQALETNLQAAKQNNAKAGRPARVNRSPSRGQLKVQTAEQMAAGKSLDPATQEIAKRAEIIRDTADVTGQGEDWVTKQLEAMKVKVLSAYEQQKKDESYKHLPDSLGRLNYGQHSAWDESNRTDDEAYYGDPNANLGDDIKALAKDIEEAFSNSQGRETPKVTKGAGPKVKSKNKGAPKGFTGRGPSAAKKKKD